MSTLSLLILFFTLARTQIDTCVNLWTPFLIDDNVGVMYSQLYGDWPGYDQHTRVSRVCIYRDDQAYNGDRERINGIHLWTRQLTSPDTHNQQPLCYGACLYLETCTDVEGEIIKFQMWYSGGSLMATGGFAIDKLKFTTTTGQLIESHETDYEDGTEVVYDFLEPWIGVYSYHSTWTLDNLGLYIGRFDKTGCDCCSGTGLIPAVIPDMTFIIDSPANSPTTQVYDSQKSPCYLYGDQGDNLTQSCTNCNCGQMTFDHTTSSDCPFVSLSVASQTGYQYTLQLSVTTTDETKVGVHTCKQRARLTYQSPTYIYQEDSFQVTITCQLNSYTSTNSAWDAQYMFQYGQSDLFLSYSYAQDPSGCFTAVYTAELDTGDAIPSFIILDDTNSRFQITTPSDDYGEGIYDVELTGTLDDIPGTTNTDNFFQVRIYDCEQTTPISQSLPDLTYGVGNAAIETAFVLYKDDRSASYGDGSESDLCGTRSYSIEGPTDWADFATLTQIDATNWKITIETPNDDTYVGEYDVIMRATMDSYPTRYLDEVFKLTINTCISSWTPDSAFDSFYIYGINSGALTIPEISFTQVPDTCGFTETMTGEQQGSDPTLPYWITYTSGVGFVVDSQVAQDMGIYYFRQRAVLGDAISTNDISNIFTIELTPCPAATVAGQEIQDMATTTKTSQVVTQQISSTWLVDVEEMFAQVKCMKRTFTLVEYESQAPVEWITFNDDTYVITLDIGNLIVPASVYTLQLTVGLDEYPYAVAAVNLFDVKLFGDIYAPDGFPDELIFYLGDEPSEFQFDYFWSEDEDPLLFLYDSKQEDGSDLPDCIVFNNSTLTYTISPDKESTYTIAIEITHVYYPTFTKVHTWLLDIQVKSEEEDYYILNTGPELDLDQEMLNQYVIGCGQPYSIFLPSPTDEEGDQILSYIVDFGNFSMANFNSWTNEVIIDAGVINWRHSGVHPVEIRLTDTRGATSNYWFDINIDCEPPPPRPPTPEEIAFIEAQNEPDPVELLPEGLTQLAIDEFSNPFIKAISSTGLVQIGFQKPLKTPVEDEMLTNLISVFENGIKVQKPALDIGVSPGILDQTNSLSLTWRIIQATHYALNIQVLFDFPDAISSNSILDQLKITLWSLEPFISAKEEEYLCVEGDEICEFLSQQEEIIEEEEGWITTIVTPDVLNDTFDNNFRRLQQIDEHVQFIKPGYYIEKPIQSQINPENKTIIKKVTLGVSLFFVLYVALCYVKAFQSGNGTLRISLSLYHMSVLFSLFLLDLRTPAMPLVVARGLYENIFQWNFIYDALYAIGWMTEQVNVNQAQNTQYLLNEHNVSSSFISMGYQSVVLLENMGFIKWFWPILVVLTMMAKACDFKGSSATINRNLLSTGEFIMIFIQQLGLPMLIFATSISTIISIGLNARYGNGFIVEAQSYMYFNYFCGAIYLVILGLFYVDISYWMRTRITRSGLHFSENARTIGSVLAQYSDSEEESIQKHDLDSSEDEEAAYKREVARRKREKNFRQLKRQMKGLYPKPPRGFQYYFDAENIRNWAKLNLLKQQKYTTYAKQKAVLTQIFRFDAIFEGLRYLGACLVMNFNLTLSVILLQKYVAFQLMVVGLSLVGLAVFCSSTQYLNKRDKAAELLNILINVITLCVLIGFSDAFELPPGSYSRKLWSYVAISCIGVSLMLNFTVLTLELIDNCSVARHKFLRFVYLREKETLAQRKQNKQLMNTICEPITQIEPDPIVQAQMRKELEALEAVEEEPSESEESYWHNDPVIKQKQILEEQKEENEDFIASALAADMMDDQQSESKITAKYTGFGGAMRPQKQIIQDNVSVGSRISRRSRTSRVSRHIQEPRLIKPQPTQQPDFKKGIDLDSDSDEKKSADGGILDELTSNLDDHSDIKPRSKITSRNGPNLVNSVNENIQLGSDILQLQSRVKAQSHLSDEESAFEILAVSKPKILRQDSQRTKVPPASGYTQHRGDVLLAEKATERESNIGFKKKKKKKKSTVFVDDKDNLEDLVI